MLKKFKKKGSSLGTIWFFLNRYKLYFLFLIGLALLTGIIESLNVALIYPIISEGMDLNFTNNAFLNFINPLINRIPVEDGMIRYCIAFIILAIMVFITKLIYYYLSVKFLAIVVVQAKQDVFNKCMGADYQFYVDNKQGELLYKISDAPNAIAKALQVMSSVFVELFLIVSVFTVLLSLSWKLVVVVIICGIIYYYIVKYLSLVVSYKTGKKLLRWGKEERVIVSEYTSGFKQIKVFETLSYWRKLFDRAINKYWIAHRKNFFWSRFPEVMIWFIVYSLIGVAVIVIKLQYPGNFKTLLPLLGTFAFGVFMILPKISRLGNFRMVFMNMLPNIETVEKLLKDKDYNQIENGEINFRELKKSIEIKNVTFAHKERDILLKDFTLKIEKGKTTALVGASGSGKTTIVNLILRLYDIDEGGVFIDDVNIKEFNIFTFLKKIGYVSQETFIFNGSIKDNITFGNEYTDEEVIAAAKMANADEFICKMPDKYDTIVGDRGMKLSGGEKQRIAIARAIIRKPEILILDEATSSLDNISEEIVQKAINKVSKKCTTFIIAHRLSTIIDADMINVLSNGKIVERGSHTELLKKKGAYFELYNKQKK